ncbi:MAG: Methyltransferase, FkbM family [Belnapia sp.]|nr:Methyltransferase, FkbM family [Belnapia sp.]
MVNATGRLIGGVAGPDGAPAIGELEYACAGDWGVRISPYTRRATIYAEAAGAWLELRLPPGPWRLLLTRHGWSGRVLVRDAKAYSIHDLYATQEDSGILEIPVVSAGEARPLRIEVTGTRQEASRNCQIWFLGLRGDGGVFYPELGQPLGPVCRLIDGIHGQFMALRTDTGVADHLAANRVWEPDSIRIFERFVSDGQVVADVGANIGHHTVVLSRLVGDQGRVLAFEPQMQMFNLLNANLVLNGCRNVIPYRKGLGAGSATMRMYPINYRSFTNFGALGIQPDGAAAAQGETVAVEPLDAVLTAEGIDHAAVGFLKMDVQSYEFYVLKGARQVLEKARPVVYLEIAPRSMRRAGYDYRDVYRLLEELGYDFLDDAQAPHVQPEWDGESFDEWNVLALPERVRNAAVINTVLPRLELAQAG